MIVGGQTEARAQLSSTIIDYHEPFDQGLTVDALHQSELSLYVNSKQFRPKSENFLVILDNDINWLRLIFSLNTFYVDIKAPDLFWE